MQRAPDPATYQASHSAYRANQAVRFASPGPAASLSENNNGSPYDDPMNGYLFNERTNQWYAGPATAPPEPTNPEAPAAPEAVRRGAKDTALRISSTRDALPGERSPSRTTRAKRREPPKAEKRTNKPDTTTRSSDTKPRQEKKEPPKEVLKCKARPANNEPKGGGGGGGTFKKFIPWCK